MIDAVLELLASESEALLTERGGADDQRLAELNVRLALAATDVLDDADAGIRYPSSWPIATR
jgi:hypothetical protein